MTPDMRTLTEELTDEQFCAMLSDDATENSDAELNSLKDALATYRTETMNWAERRSSAQPSLVAAAARKSLWAAAPQWALAAVAVMTVTAGALHLVGSGADTSAANEQAANAMYVPHPTPQQQIAEDNALLKSIDCALNTAHGLSTDGLGLEHGSDMDHHGSDE
ncbi:MAG: hypothetical protein V4734_07765 [Terriglobus sp.]